jgi:hypothetical protein
LANKRNATQYKSFLRYEDFIKGNKKTIDDQVKEIKEKVSMIKDIKLRDKKFKEKMRDYRIQLTKIWSKTK